VGLRVRRGLGTSDEVEAQRLVDQLNEVLGDEQWWKPAMRATAERLYDQRIAAAFYDDLVPTQRDFRHYWTLRDSVIALPGPDQNHTRVQLVGTTGAGKTTLLRQLIGTNPRTERFPSTSAAKTTVADAEFVLAAGPYSAVVSFHPRELVQTYVEENVIGAALAHIEERPDAEITRRLLEHSTQRFRLSYLLGTLPSDDQDDLADEDTPTAEDGVDESERDNLSPEERTELESKLRGYVAAVKTLAAAVRDRLAAELGIDASEASKKDRDVLEEILEEQFHTKEQQEAFQDLVEKIVDEIEERFDHLDVGHLVRGSDQWPSHWAFETTDRAVFVRTVNGFTSNYAPNFGRLLSPLVQGIRVKGPFRPAWTVAGRIPPLVLMDGEGLGHIGDSATSLPTDVTERFEQADVILLVDSAAQPMQVGPITVLRSLLSSGHAGKLALCFTHFDAVQGDNLPTAKAKKAHVLGSIDNAVAALEKDHGVRAVRMIRSVLTGRTFFVSNIQKEIDPAKAKATRTELDRLLALFLDVRTPAAPPTVEPTHDEAKLMLRIAAAARAFHEPWRARLKLPSRAAVPPEHWTRIKALARRPAELGLDEYHTLRPVADMIRHLVEQISPYLDEPQGWTPDERSEEVRQATINLIKQQVYRRLHTLARRRLIAKQIIEWQGAFNVWGQGSSYDRARRLDAIYTQAFPLVGEIEDEVSREFVKEIRALVREAVAAVGEQPAAAMAAPAHSPAIPPVAVT
jgi:ABC-type dipeptide/oligopeptide/nickel transport system ATPase subunit